MIQRTRSNLRRSTPTVVWTPSAGLGWGNMLYLYLHAFLASSKGIPTRVLTSAGVRPWLAAFPTLRAGLAIERSDVRSTQRRVVGWWSQFGVDFTRADLDAFVHAMLMPDLGLREANPSSRLVLNVRRGNYYSEPHFRGTYSFDLAEYIDLAMASIIRQDGPVESIFVVSDDIGWCQVKLPRVLRQHSENIVYSPQGDMLADFRSLCGATLLVGTNSTFSYWGGYVSGTIFGLSSHVAMPRFHGRLLEGWEAIQLDPSWLVIEDIPGGWNG